MNSHEYALLGGPNRAKIGRYLGSIAAAISSVAVFLFLSAEKVAAEFNMPISLPPAVISLAMAGTIYALLYWTFAKHIWKWRPISNLLNVPDLSGHWHCYGQTINPDKSPGFKWEAKVTIVQSWDKIRVRLKTKQSGSNSVSASLLADEVDGYKLLYNYKNEPNVDEPDLKNHNGFAEINFSKDLKSAAGTYFNGIDRFTFGTMRLMRF
jgi:SMODS-associating 2TM, beta-strand rich effector domain